MEDLLAEVYGIADEALFGTPDSPYARIEAYRKALERVKDKTYEFAPMR